MEEITAFPIHRGLVMDRSHDSHPSKVSCWAESRLALAEGDTHFGIVTRGRARLRSSRGDFELSRGMYFCLPHGGEISGGEGLIASRKNFEGLFSIGGPVEEFGRLRYISGCSDSVLIAPPVCGDPCFNMLFVPPGIDQTAHTHPTVRVGVVLAGRGTCETPSGTVPLDAGNAFVLPPNVIHSFHTQSEFMRIVVYHPDSDHGPSHESHPMLNRTYVDGVSAAALVSTKSVVAHARGEAK